MELVRAEDFSPILSAIVRTEFASKKKGELLLRERMTRFVQYAAPFFDLSPEDMTFTARTSMNLWPWIRDELQITTRDDAERLLDLMQPLFAKQWKRTTRSSDLLYFAEHSVPPRQTEPKVSSDEIRLIALEFIAKEMKPILPYIEPASFLDTLNSIGEMGMRMTEVPYITTEMLGFTKEVVEKAQNVWLTTEPVLLALDTRIAYADLLNACHVARAMTMGLQAIEQVSKPMRDRVNAKWSKKLRKHFGVLPLRLLLT